MQVTLPGFKRFIFLALLLAALTWLLTLTLEDITYLIWKDSRLVIRDDGLVELRGDLGRRHPVRELIRDGERVWKDKLRSQSTTLKRAVATYKLRYGINPPKGFEEWWKFTRHVNHSLPDAYDQVFSDIVPLLALPPALLNSRLNTMIEQEPFQFTFRLTPSSLMLLGERAGEIRPQQFGELVEGFRQFLPNDFKIKGIFSDHDLGTRVIIDEYREAALKAVLNGSVLSEDQWTMFENNDRSGALALGPLNACKPESPAATWLKEAGPDSEKIDPEDLEVAEDADTNSSGQILTFLRDPNRAYDYCLHPRSTRLHGTLSWEGRRDARVIPQFVLSKLAKAGELLSTPLEAYENTTTFIPWANRTTDKIFWRGTTTGDFFSHANVERPSYNWRDSHRIRLHTLTNAHSGSAEVLFEYPSPSRVVLETKSLAALNEKYMDVGLTGEPHQCETSVCEEMKGEIKGRGWIDPREASKYKYVFDIDGNGWSSRYHRLLASGAVVMKCTSLPEWNTERLIPWVHYIPISLDLSDVYHTISFFVGNLDGTGGHDFLAERIAENAREWTEKFWRWEDMQAYMFRLLLEYRRAMADDRDAMSWGGKMNLS